MDHKDLEVWKRSVNLVKHVYISTSTLPALEKFGLTMQMRRAAISIISNIAEGAARGSDREMIRFLRNSLGSAAELETQIVIARELDYLKDSTGLEKSVQHIEQLLIGLINYLKSKPRI